MDGETTNNQGFNRETALKNAMKVLKKLEVRLCAERFRELETDKDYLAFVRHYATLLTAINTIHRDGEIECIEARLTELEENQRGCSAN